VAHKPARGAGRTAVAALRELGAHPEGGVVAVYAGRYGPYVKWDKVNATLPREQTAEAVTLDEALTLIAAKRPERKGGTKTAASAKAPAKAAKKKAPAGKVAARKAASK
jgi:DNA topoisomerase-1